MIKIIKNDFYRLVCSKLFYIVLGVSMLISAFLSLVLRSDIRIGISIFGNLTTFKGVEDLVLIGTQYYKGLGFLIAIIISIFIGQDYLWKTLCNKWNITKSRTKMYLSKLLLSCVVSVIIYISFQTMVLIFSAKGELFFYVQYLLVMASGILPYIALGSVFTLISTTMKNNIYAVITCLGYVLLSETFASLALNLASSAPIIETIIRHSVYGMSQSVNITITISKAFYLLLNAVVVSAISSIIGLIIFKNQEI